MKEGDIFTVIYATECRIYTDAFPVLRDNVKELGILAYESDVCPKILFQLRMKGLGKDAKKEVRVLQSHYSIHNY